MQRVIRTLKRQVKTYAAPTLLGVAAAWIALALHDRVAAPTDPASVLWSGPISTEASRSLQRRHQHAALGCAEAAEVGLAPAYRGQPGYWPQWDGDDDGISCERWHGR